jgi:serine/threonine protein kinase
MANAEWDEVSPYLDEVFEMSEPDRTEWLSALRARDPQLAARLEPFLDAHCRLEAERFLEDEKRPETFRRAQTLVGQRIGAYAIVSLLGEGGMGGVWLAERSDGELQQKVAIKFLTSAAHRPGWVERFLRERQLLAALNHQSIVHLLDAGRTEDGLPYLVMEYVEGQPIDRYAADIPVRERLALFLHVCDAVAHAHRRLVIHRDLKPSNILVDHAGQPKLLDFGIGKLVDETADSTITVERVLTPGYASPEQLRGRARTTSTDIYSLGAVLYKLLTGRSPNDVRASTPDHGERRGQMRDLPPATRLNPCLPADIDYVLRRALREEPEERYMSVEALAGDVRAVLESRAVDARAGDTWYRARRFMLRHWLPITAAALLLLSFTVGLYTTRRERATALRRFAQVRQLANEFIALDGEIRNLPGSVNARHRIVSESLKYLNGLGAEGRDDPELALEIGNAYLQIARVQGVPASVGNLGELSQAEASLREADRLVETVLTTRPNDRGALLTSAEIEHDWMAVVDYQDRRDEALAHARKAAGQLDRFLGFGVTTPADVDDATHIYANIATAYFNSGQYDQSVRFLRRALEISEGVEAARMRRATALGKLANALTPSGDLDGALAAIQESRTILEDVTAKGGGVAERINLINALVREGAILGDVVLDRVNLDQPAKALTALKRAVDVAEPLAATDPRDYRSRRLIASASVYIGAIVGPSDPLGALAVYDHALARLREVAANARTQRDASLLLAGSSYAARALHHESDATRRLDEAFRLLRETKQYPTDRIEPGRSEPAVALRALADHHHESGQPEQAVIVYNQLLAGMIAWKADPENNLFDASAFSTTWSALSSVLRQLGRSDDAQALDERRAELWRKWSQKRPSNLFVRRQLESPGSR